MDMQKYYESDKNNMYNVHFPNKLGYSIDEIKEIFSEFGDVVAVTKAGDDYGFRFVKFRNEEEVQRCVEGLKNHKTIRLLPKRPKQNNDQRNAQRNNNWTNKRESRESKGNWATWEQKKPEDGEKSRQNNSRRTESHREYTDRRSNAAATPEEAAQSHDEKPQQTSVTVVTLNEDKIENWSDPSENHQERVNNCEEVASVNEDNTKRVDSPVQTQVPVEVNKVCNPAVPPTAPSFAATTTLQTRLPQTVTEEATSSLADVAARNKPDPAIATSMPTEEATSSLADVAARNKPDPAIATPMPTEEATSSLADVAASSKPDPAIATPMPTTRLITPEIVGEDLPKLVQKSSKSEKPLKTKNPKKLAEMKQLTVEAEAIVVGNVHTDYGVHYILHLFEKHDPICVSPMKIILKHGLRYCVVYVQSPLQASDIEEKFDNYSLCGKELIVLRAQKLAQLADEL